MRRIFVLCTILFASFNSIAIVASTFDLLDPDYDSNKITVLDFILNHDKSYITFIMDHDQNIFLIKQSRGYKLAVREGPLLSVREMLAGYIAESNGILANRVRIIPAGYALPGKLYVQRPATLHTLAPGKPPVQLFIHQPMNKKFSKEQWGLSYKVIHDMSLHPDLPLIVAFDSFIANGARRRSSLFYDEKSDRFCAIDLESSFKKNLCKLACNRIDTLLQDKTFKLTSQELCGLILYRDTLKKLNERHSPEELHMKLDEFLLQAGIIPSSSLFNDKVADMIQFYKKNIFENYKHSQELVLLLDRLITYHQDDKDLSELNYGYSNFLHKEQERSDIGVYYSGASLDDYISDRLQAYKCALFAHE